MTGVILLIMQSTSEDCVSRQAVNEYLEKLLDGRFDDFMSAAIIGIRDNINAMPPVTPTHGTCKDCEYYFDISKDNNIGNIYKANYCRKHSKNVHREDFYCADYEKRGSEKERR